MTLLILSTAGAVAAVDHKSPKECNTELYSRLNAIKDAGETPAQFIHECWWHSKPGQPTQLARDTPMKAEPGAQIADAPASNAAEARQASSWNPTEPPRASLKRPARNSHIARATRRRGWAFAMRQGEFRKTARTAMVQRRFLRNRLARQETLHRVFRRDELAVSEGLRRRVLRERLARLEPLHRLALRRRSAAAWTTRRVADQRRPSGPIESGDLRSVVASQGPSAKLGRHMWVQVVTSGGAQIKHALLVGGLPEGAERTNALNCWGQPVLFVGRDATHWSRSMVCDDKPAGANEWSAQIYYGGAETAKAR